MNKWKVSFYSTLAALIITIGVAIYMVIDQGVTLSYQQEGYSDTENDLNTLVDIINNTGLSKNDIENKLRGHRLYPHMDFKTDTVSLERILLVFKNDTLRRVEKDW